MSRALSSTFVEAVNAAETDEAFLVLVTIDDADLASPIRVTSDSVKTYSADQDSTTAADSTANGNDGTLQNDPQWTSDEVTDQIVGALSFDGVDQWVKVSDTADLEGMTALTIEAWVYVDDVSSDRDIVWKGGHSGGQPYGIWADAGTGKFISLVTDDNGDTDAITSSSDVPTASWVHIALVFDATTTFKFFIDGVEDADESAGVSNVDQIASTVDDVAIVGSTNLFGPYKGKATEVRIWNVARTQQQIQDNMNKRLNGDESGLVGYWRLDDTVNQYEPFPFEVELPDDTDDMGGSLARLRMDAVDRRVVEAVRKVSGVPEVTLEVVLASDPDTVEVSWPTFSLSNARYGDLAIEADLTLEVLDQEPFPGDSMNPALFPGMY